MVTIYGINTCDATKKAIAWLKKKKIDYQFHDYRNSGIGASKLNEWINREGLDKILNKKSTTWRSLSPGEQLRADTQPEAIQLIQENTTLIKRPILEKGNTLIVGPDEKRFEEAFI